MTRDLVPFRQFVLKVHSRCDLACDHCYVYEQADQSWRSRPRVMSHKTITRAAERIAEHAKAHRLGLVHVVLHGGEPLLAGPATLGFLAEVLGQAVAGVCDLDLRIHTNGVLLDDRFCQLFAAYRIKVGISLDGDRAANDRHRRYADGRSSYDKVIAAVGLLGEKRYRALYAGLLCTIDIANDPVTTYDALRALDPPLIDFLLPHATWDNPPVRPADQETAYADWLIAIFDHWISGRHRVPVRLFESIIETTHGGASLTEAMGLSPSDLVVIETDGSLEQADSLKTAYDGAPATGLDIFRHSLDAAARHSGIAARQEGLAGLCAKCRACPVVTSCGGGLYAHRYRTGTGFANPSVYCDDLMKLINHVRQELRPAVTSTGRQWAAHALPGDEFDALAAGLGGATAVACLAGSQRSLGRGLLGAIRDRAAAGASPDADAARAGWDLLTGIDRTNPAAVDHVLAHPYVRAWGVPCLRQLAGGRGAAGLDPDAGLDTDAGHLAAIAAAAAIRGGGAAELPVPVRDGAVHLPTVGRLQVGAAAGAGPPGTAVITVERGGFTVQVGTRTWTVTPAGVTSAGADPGGAGRAGGADDWQPVRTLDAGGFTAAMEDTDPYRDCHQWPVAGRLTEDQFAGWQRMFQGAWELIAAEYPSYAAGLRAGLSTIMPLAGSGDGRVLSAAAKYAFGAVAVAQPADESTLALLLMHEFQHVKLDAVLEMIDLYHPGGSRTFYAPWRDDKRPIGALLQGTYAHLAVTDFWRLRRHAVPRALAGPATTQFARWRIQTAGAIDTLAGSGLLTEVGQLFVARMRETITPWLDEPVPAAALAEAQRRADEHRVAWAVRAGQEA